MKKWAKNICQSTVYATVSHLSLSQALAGCSEDMCIWINKSWYRDTVVPFQWFLQLISIIKSSRFESAAAKDTFIECGMGKGMRSSFFVFFAATTIMLWWKSIFIHVFSWSLCYFVHDFRHAVIWNTVFSWWHGFCQIVYCDCASCWVIDNVLASVQLNLNDGPLLQNGN